MLAHISSLVALALIVPFTSATPASPSLSISVPSDPTISSVAGILSPETSEIPSVTDIPSAVSSILLLAVTSLSSSVPGILSSVTGIPSSFSGITAAESESGSGSWTPNPSTPISSFSTSTLSSSFEPLPTGIPSAMCDKANRRCCAVARPENDSEVSQILDAFDIDRPGDPNTLVGVISTSMTTGITELDDSLCTGDTQEPLCYSDNSHDGVVAIDCVPISQSTT